MEKHNFGFGHMILSIRLKMGMSDVPINTCPTKGSESALRRPYSKMPTLSAPLSQCLLSFSLLVGSCLLLFPDLILKVNVL